MYVGEKRICNSTWEELAEVNTGDSFLIQNISEKPISYVVLDSVPDETIKGGVLRPYQQLSFKKVAGNLYMKRMGECNGYVVIEKVES